MTSITPQEYAEFLRYRGRREDALKKINALSVREREVAFLVYRGKTSQQIGEFLGISRRTVESHRYNILIKLRVATTIDIALIFHDCWL